ncbi:unnamed protein product [Schistocephalus solidus]|uniref:Zf-LYAR domain-containing protein n=1 Tax=Schistocephalus solidus TaxID=70667 RepID=A0A183SFC6_SCHSO|nr:unnamed protein product [Schistocephalus solidus]
MVVFVCGKCNESIKKKNVEQHFNNCRNSTVSCVDCSKDFTYSFASHTSCITEQEKYDKPNFAQKVPKGASKQMEWTEQVHSRLSNFPAHPGVINLMVKKLMDSSNVPKKKAKFYVGLKFRKIFILPPKKRQRKNTTECVSTQPNDVSEVTCTPELSTGMNSDELSVFRAAKSDVA